MRLSKSVLLKKSTRFFCGSVAAALFATVGTAAAQSGGSIDELKAAFANPPADTRPGCYWYWINDNISTQGITRDLEAMARVGIGRAFIGHIYNHDTPADTPVGNVKFMSDEWWEALQWAVKEAGRCGVDIGFFNSAGWSQSGAPWIKPSQSMRYLGHSETKVTGGKTIETTLPLPEIDTYPNYGGSSPVRTGPNFSAEDFQDVRVVAFRQPKEGLGVIPTSAYTATSDHPELQKLFDGSDETSATFSPGQITDITLRLGEESRTSHPVQAAVITPVEHAYTLICHVEASPDGRSFREVSTYTEERGHQGPKNKADIVVPLSGITDEYIRLKLQFNFGPGERKLPIAEIALTSEALLPAYARKQLGETSPNIIIPVDAYTWDENTTPTEGTAIASEDVIDLTDKVNASGKLTWEAPAGNWTILRTGMVPIGTQCAPCSPESRGLEIDKMNKEHAQAIFDGMVGEFLRRTPEQDRTALKYVIADSYETGPQNWTDGMIEKFSQRFGYSPTRYLPVMTGRVVDSPDVSNRFLWDLRRLVVESVAYDYVGGLREAVNKHGLILWLENYGHWGFISEFLLYGSQTDQVGGEVWESSNPATTVECRSAASSAHIYGKNEVFAEVFTSSRTFKQSPATLKRWCDWTFGTGINHMILHVYIHQNQEKKPGIIQWFGTAFNRHNTWFEQSTAFMDYMRRGAVMLKAGRPVADVAYYIGENSPSMTGPMEPALPSGYDFDHINSDVLINHATVKDGRVIASDHSSYAVLVLPRLTEMRPEVAEAVKKLANDGAIIIGPKPEKSPSLQNYPECDVRVKQLADEVWGEVDGKTVKERQVGKGWIYDGMTLEQVFTRHNITPDVQVTGAGELPLSVAGDGKLGVNENGGILFKHRSAEDADIYFVSNTSTVPADLQVSFRQSGRRPSLWNAVSGTVKDAGAFTPGDRTTVPIKLEPSESLYVVFGEKLPPDSKGDAASNEPAWRQVAELNSDWTVRFEGQGAPATVNFDQLVDWIKHQDEKIRQYSGSAIYEKTFSLDESTTGRVILDLGSVSILASVTVNGKPAGIVWTNPWELDITDLVETGDNRLEIQVTNTWNNRLASEDALPADQRQTYVSQKYQYDKANPLVSSGLLGPVSVKVVE